MKVAVFGGSFNPPHVAHVLAASWVLTTQDVDRLLIVPAFVHPFAKVLAPYEDRVRMCELALAWLPGVSVSRVEGELGGESKTLRTLEHLARAHKDWGMRLVVGTDVLAETPKWFRWDRIQEIAPPIVVGRSGWEGPTEHGFVLPAISSTDVRDRIARGDWASLEAIVPRGVLEHVRVRGLYAGGVE